VVSRRIKAFLMPSNASFNLHDATQVLQAELQITRPTQRIPASSQPSVGILILRDFDGLELLVVLGRLDVLDNALGC
jgi:hypothetical protein